MSVSFIYDIWVASHGVTLSYDVIIEMVIHHLHRLVIYNNITIQGNCTYLQSGSYIMFYLLCTVRCQLGYTDRLPSGSQFTC